MASPFAPKCLCLDIETAATDALALHKFGAWRPDNRQSLCVSGHQMPAALARIDALTDGASFVVGHNVIRHDLPAVDTLELSPLAFPENPYHSLVMDYKLVRDARNDPLKDAQLYYVGMTRAQETLTLCESSAASNPFSPCLTGTAILRRPLPQLLPDCSGLTRHYRTLTLSDVVLGFAGRKPANDPIHTCLDRLDHGQPLHLIAVGTTWELRLPDQNLVVGRLSGKCALPAATHIEAWVDCIIRRHHHQSKPEYADQDKLEHWYVVLPTLSWMETD